MAYRIVKYIYTVNNKDLQKIYLFFICCLLCAWCCLMNEHIKRNRLQFAFHFCASIKIPGILVTNSKPKNKYRIPKL